MRGNGGCIWGCIRVNNGYMGIPLNDPYDTPASFPM